jgi:hypothetical protein
MFGIFCDPVPVNESVLILPIVGVKTDADAVAVGLVRNFNIAGAGSSNCDSKRLPSILGGLSDNR